MDWLIQYSTLLFGMGAVGGAVAAFIYLPAPWNLRAVVGIAWVASGFFAYSYGFGTMRERCEAAARKFQAQIEARDLEIAKKAGEIARVLEQKRKADKAISDKVEDYEAQLSKLPNRDCTLTDAELRRLRNIK